MSATSIKNELLAGLTTFSTMAYIVILNPQILSATGMDFGAVMMATILSAAVASLMMGLLANYPFALAPGMGLNVYFAYGIVLKEGIPWETALSACFIAGALMLFLSLIGLRQKIQEAIPTSLQVAITAGIGLFLIFIGFQNVELITAHEKTLVTLGDMRTVPVLFTFFGIFLIAILETFRIRGTFLITIFSIWLLALLFNVTTWNGLFSLPPSMTPTFMKLQFSLSPEIWPVVMTFVLIGMLDAAGTLMSLARHGDFLKEGKLPAARATLACDAVGTMTGALLGSSPITTHLESASGISSGGKTGITAITVGLLFLLTLFLYPLVMSIPLFATAPVLICVGILMLKSLKYLPWDDPTECIPAGIILATIPLTYSIATGISLGIISYPLIKLLTGRYREVHPLLWLFALFFIFWL